MIPIREGGKMVGHVHGDTFFTDRTKSLHYFHKWGTYGISESVLQQIGAAGAYNVRITENLTPGHRILLSRVADWWEKGRVYINPQNRADIQRHLRPSEMRDELGNPIGRD